MKEDFLHYLWHFQKLGDSPLKTDSGAPIQVVNPGIPNSGDGPDFINGKVWIGDTLWAGDIELHLKSSSWYHHRHHMDKYYDAVVLHVVWENDGEVCYPSGRLVPCLELSQHIPLQWIQDYQQKFKNQPHWIPCEKLISNFPQIKWNNWKERLYLERLETKTMLIQQLLKANKNHWEETLFQLLAKNFGLNRNGNAFLKWAQHLPFGVVQKSAQDVRMLEALFFGISGLLEGELEVPYKKELHQNYYYLKQKFGFKEIPGIKVSFSRLRPPNFPTVRLSQLAQLYSHFHRPFSRLISAENLSDLDWIRKIGVSEFWKTHFTFEKESSSSPKRISQSFFELLLINTLIPFRFAYARKQGAGAEEKLLQWIQAIPTEQNSITMGFSQLGLSLQSALDSQSLLQLKNYYCDKKKCLRCAVGFHLFDFSS
ncbi:MAG: DUF2851 family protein [Flavobacteriaceae bacterium]|jgi:hypothetical protein